MQNAKDLMISASDLKRLSIKNVNNRPNALATYGQAKMNATEAKELFDRQFEFMCDKFNKLCEYIANLDLEYATDKELENVKGVSGKITLTEWTGDESGIISTKRIDTIGQSDAVFFVPESAKDKDLMVKYNVWISPHPIDSEVRFYAETLPVENITLLYFVARGVT